MNRAIVRSTLAQLLTQPVRLGALAGAALLPLLQLAVDPEPRFGRPLWTILVAVIASAGIIGVEVSTGSVALFFTRPITRAAYVISRWTAALAVACGAVALSLGGEALVIALRDGELHSWLYALAERLFVAAGIVTVMTAFSTLATSLGDLVIWLSLNIVAMSLRTASEAASIEWIAGVALVLQRIAIPEIDVSRWPLSAIAGYAATLLFAIAIATMAMNRKELSYASE